MFALFDFLQYGNNPVVIFHLYFPSLL